MGIQLLCTFILARYLTPSDYGIIGMLAVFNAVANSFIDSGFGLSLIREKWYLERIILQYFILMLYCLWFLHSTILMFGVNRGFL